MVIDGHCHAGTGPGLTAPWNTEARLEPYLRRARVAGIDRTVIVPVAPRGDYSRANQQVGRIAARHPGRLICFAAVHPRRQAGMVRAMLDEAVNRWSARGLKVHAMDAPISREICEAARALHLLVLYDVAGATGLVEMAATQYPDVPFVVPHLGSFADEWKAHVSVIDQLVRLPNVYADTSGVRTFDYLVQAVERAGAHKLVFGSDGPQLHPALELHKVRLLRLAPEEEVLVLGGNLQRLLSRAMRGTVAVRRSRGRGPGVSDGRVLTRRRPG